MQRECNDLQQGVLWEEGCGPGWLLRAGTGYAGRTQPRKGRVS